MAPLDREALARRGAEAELAELDVRRQELLAFLRGPKKPRATTEAPVKTGRRVPMSPEEKAVLSQKMKALWEQKKHAAAQGDSGKKVKA